MSPEFVAESYHGGFKSRTMSDCRMSYDFGLAVIRYVLNPVPS
jgi:hypothetical protein